MLSHQMVNRSHLSRFWRWEHFASGLCALLDSLLVTMQSQRMNPPHTFNIIQTRVDAFVR